MDRSGIPKIHAQTKGTETCEKATNHNDLIIIFVILKENIVRDNYQRGGLGNNNRN